MKNPLQKLLLLELEQLSNEELKSLMNELYNLKHKSTLPSREVKVREVKVREHRTIIPIEKVKDYINSIWFDTFDSGKPNISYEEFISHVHMGKPDNFDFDDSDV